MMLNLNRLLTIAIVLVAIEGQHLRYDDRVRAKALPSPNLSTSNNELDGVAIEPVPAYPRYHGKDAASISPGTLNKMRVAHMYAAAVYCNDNVRPSEDGRWLMCGWPACSDLMTPIRGLDFAAYRPKTALRFDKLGSHQATGFVAVHHARSKIIVAFRTSEALQKDFANMNFRLHAADDICESCEIFTGFHQYWEAIDDQILTGIDRLKRINQGYIVDVVGHGLGGAIATIAAAKIRQAGHRANLFTFGSPRVGNEAFAGFASDWGDEYGLNFRMTHKGDWLSRVPPYGKYQHVENEYYIPTGGQSKLLYQDIAYFHGREVVDTQGGNIAMETIDFTLGSNNWIFDDISACQPKFMEMKSWVTNGAKDFSYMQNCIMNPPGNCTFQAGISS